MCTWEMIGEADASRFMLLVTVNATKILDYWHSEKITGDAMIASEDGVKGVNIHRDHSSYDIGQHVMICSGR